MLTTYIRNNKGLILATFVMSQFIAMYRVRYGHEAPWQTVSLATTLGALIFCVLHFTWFGIRQRKQLSGK